MKSNNAPTQQKTPPPLLPTAPSLDQSVPRQPPPTAAPAGNRLDVDDLLWKLKTANYKSLLFTVIFIPLLGMIYWIVNAQGIRMSIPIFGMKLYKVPFPGFSFLANYKGLRDLDLAHVFALFMLFAVWYLSVRLLKILLFGYDRQDGINAGFDLRFLFCVSAVVILIDVTMFYRGIADQGGLLTGTGGLTPLIATVGYSGLLAFVAYTHLMLQRRSC